MFCREFGGTPDSTPKTPVACHNCNSQDIFRGDQMSSRVTLAPDWQCWQFHLGLHFALVTPSVMDPQLLTDTLLRYLMSALSHLSLTEVRQGVNKSTPSACSHCVLHRRSWAHWAKEQRLWIWQLVASRRHGWKQRVEAWLEGINEWVGGKGAEVMAQRSLSGAGGSVEAEGSNGGLWGRQLC